MPTTYFITQFKTLKFVYLFNITITVFITNFTRFRRVKLIKCLFLCFAFYRMCIQGYVKRSLKVGEKDWRT